MDAKNDNARPGRIDVSQFHAVFFEEADEHLASMEALLLALNVAQPDEEAVNAVFRAAHSIKGSAGMFGFTDITALTHEAETLLDRVRKLELPLTVEIVDALLETRDILNAQLSVHRGEGGGAPDASMLIERLCALTAGTEQHAGAPPAEDGAGYGFFAPLSATGSDDGFGLFEASPLAAAEEAYGLFDEAFGSGPAAAVTAPKATTPAGSRGVIANGERTGETASIRVPVGKVDQLINLVGELVITQAMLTQNGSELDPVRHQTLLARMADLERNTRDLQESVMSIRMTPIAMVFNRFPRMLRDLAGKLGKKVDLKMVGENTELDKGLIEKVTDPITHLVRNSVDHGIEMPATRLEAGKPEAGTITLSAYHRGGNIVIEVADDGAGLNRDRILAKARERGIDVPANPSDNDVWNLIFEPGFSTANVVTDISGRGVGMDVVRRNIGALGGSIEIDSAAGVGTRMTVRLPLTLAIMDGMSVAIGGEIYILPLASVVESLQADSKALRPVTGQGRVIDVRGEYLPILRLADAFPPARSGERRDVEIVVIIEADGVKTALVVDELVGQHQVVVKSLETNYRRQPGLSGATIMGDGRVALILDVSALTRKSRH